MSKDGSKWYFKNFNMPIYLFLYQDMEFFCTKEFFCTTDITFIDKMLKYLCYFCRTEVHSFDVKTCVQFLN